MTNDLERAPATASGKATMPTCRTKPTVLKSKCFRLLFVVQRKRARDSTKANNPPESKASKPGALRTASSARAASDSLQRAQQLMSPQLRSPILNSGWGRLRGGRCRFGRQSCRAIAAMGKASLGDLPPTMASARPHSRYPNEVLVYGSSGTVVFEAPSKDVRLPSSVCSAILSTSPRRRSPCSNPPTTTECHPLLLQGADAQLPLHCARALPCQSGRGRGEAGDYRDLSNLLEPKRALQQITSVCDTCTRSRSCIATSSHRTFWWQRQPAASTSRCFSPDFGLSKRLDGMAQTSFSQTVNNPGGTVAGVLQRS